MLQCLQEKNIYIQNGYWTHAMFYKLFQVAAKFFVICPKTPTRPPPPQSLLLLMGETDEMDLS